MCKNGGQKQNIRKLKIGTKTAHGKMSVTKYCRYRAILLPFPALSLSLSFLYFRKTKEAQQRFQEQRAEEIVSTMRRVKELARKRSMEVAHTVEEAWRESEQKAKAFERTRKASFNQARKLSMRVSYTFT